MLRAINSVTENPAQSKGDDCRGDRCPPINLYNINSPIGLYVGFTGLMSYYNKRKNVHGI